jgi:ABC-type multidrug transport system fused ATPase/permease subunit
MKTFKNFLFICSYTGKKKLIFLYFFPVFTSLSEIIGIISVMPFVAILADPKLVEKNIIINKIYNFTSVLGIDTISEFTFFLLIIFCFLYSLSLILRVVGIFIQEKYFAFQEYRLATLLMEHYLQHSYSWFLNRNSSVLGSKILSEVGKLVSLAIVPFFQLINSLVAIIFLIFLLLLVNYKITMIIILVFSFSYISIYFFTKNFLSQVGKIRLELNKARFKSISETFNAIKEIKLSGLENFYLKSFVDPSKSYYQHAKSVTLIGQLPRYILEGVAIVAFLLMIFFSASQKNLIEILPFLAVYFFAGYRLMPALQNIYLSISQLRFAGPTINALHSDIKDFQKIKINKTNEKLFLKKSIVLNKIYYSYPNDSSRIILKNINLAIKANSTVGFIGATGSGKTTLIDLILGLLQPQSGSIEVDGIIIDQKNIKRWQNLIGYVPQNIYLSDDSVAANIAFGVEKENINLSQVMNVAKLANVHEFVTNNLKNQYYTNIGERGVRLSGGERQRIGIARALYHTPSLLILDEATSALDNITEKIVMDTINNISNTITILIIAHRLETVKNCDNLFVLESGELKAQGNFQELSKNNLISKTIMGNL